MIKYFVTLVPLNLLKTVKTSKWRIKLKRYSTPSYAFYIFDKANGPKLRN